MRTLSSLGSLCLFLVLWAPPAVQAQATGTVTGVVTSQAGQPLSGVQVSIPGTARGSLTRSDGRYLITAVPAGQHQVRATLIGYGTREETVTVVAGETATANFQLVHQAVELEEVVVVGYGVQQRQEVTGAVASVSAEEIQQIPTANVVDALRGRVAGVDVVANSRVPGADARIRIRGERSIRAGNEPLLVVDGVPISGRIGDIPVHDIESIEILKDASATAIYGARGANGVVLISTRSGREGGTRITYDTYVGAQSVINEVPVFNGQEFAEFRREAQRGAGVANPRDEDIFYPVELESLALGRSTDWMSLIRRTGSQQNHNFGVSWGNEATRFATSVNWFQHDGVTRGEDFERSNVSLNVEHDASDRFRLGASLQLANSVQQMSSNLTAEARQNSPLGIPYDAEGNLLFQPTPDGFRVNPLTDLENILDERTRWRAFGNIFAEYELADGLTWRGMLGPDVSLSRQGFSQGQLTREGSYARINENRIFGYTLDNIVTYQRALATNHRVNATLLYSIQQEQIEDHLSEVSQLPYDHQLFYNLGTAGAIQGVGSNLQEWTLESYMGRVNYSLLDRYLLTVTGRLDGSSRLADGNKYALFPSAAVAWRLSEEAFLRNVASVTELKLRASYGRTGNTAIDPYMTQGALDRTVYSTGNAPAFGYKPGQLENPALEWEKTDQLDVGLDFGILNNRISGTVDVYRSRTRDLLLLRQLPPTSGFTSVLENIGETKNEGIELSLSTINVDRGSFRWSTDLSWSRNRNAIVNLYGDQQDDVGNRWFIGHPIQVWYDYQFDGIWQLGQEEQAAVYRQRPGEIRVVDQNGDGQITDEDRVILGSPYPDWVGGLTNYLQWRNVDLSVFLMARRGSMLFSTFNATSLQGRYNVVKTDYWTPTNPSNTHPRPNAGQQSALYNDSRAYQDGSYVSVRNITLGFTLPERLTQRYGARSLRIYGQAQDPFLFTNYLGYDPETGASASPPYRTLLIGLNLGL